MTKFGLLLKIAFPLSMALLLYFFSSPLNQDFEIKQKKGVLGCISKRYYLELLENLRKDKPEEIRKMINDHKCFFFKPGEVVQGKKTYCQGNSDINQIELYATKRFILGRIWLPCMAFFEDHGPKNSTDNAAKNPKEEFESIISF